jgi:hypothetical protein
MQLKKALLTSMSLIIVERATPVCSAAWFQTEVSGAELITVPENQENGQYQES